MKIIAQKLWIIALATLPLTALASQWMYIPYVTAKPVSPEVLTLDDFSPTPNLDSCSNELAQKAKLFHSVLERSAKSDSVKEVFDYLDKLSFKDSCGNEDVKLHVASNDIGRLGDVSFFYIGDEANRYDKLYRYMYAAPSVEAAWQIYLLYTSSTVMPLFWHGGYNRCSYIFDEADINNIDSWQQDQRPLDGLDLRGLSKANLLLPEVKMSHGGREADVYCTYWNDWQGLVRDHLRIEFLNDGKVELTKCDPDILVAYDCGICF